MPANTTSLYTTLANAIGVSSNNYTTLYNSSGTEILTQGPYGNANVEAFLNAGSDAGGNTVQNINMSGTITIGTDMTVNGQSNLGDVANVHITGGGLNYTLITNGGGGLSWAPPDAGPNIIPFLHFDVASTGNNQTFTDTDLELYVSNIYMNVMKNGVNIEPTLYEKTSNNTLQINILLETGDTIDVLATNSGNGNGANGSIYEIQFNDGVGGLASDPLFTFTPASGTMVSPNVTVSDNFAAANITVTNNANLGNVGNVIIEGGTSGQFLSTDGVGNLTWQDVNITTLTIDVANLHISGGTNGYVLQTDGSGNLSWTAQTGGGGGSTPPGGASSQFQYNNSGSFGGVTPLTYNGANVILSNIANLKLPGGTSGQVLSTDGASNLSWTSTIANATHANSSNTANTVTDASQSNITSLGTLTGLTSTGVIDFIGTSNVSLGSNANVHITGGTNGQLLSTNGSGNLTWVNPGTAINANYANYAGNVVNSSQSNITSLGTLTDLSSGGNVNFTTAGNVSLGSNVNVHITGGTSGQFLSTDGSGGLSWATVSGAPGGSTTQLQYNNGGVFGGIANVTTNGSVVTFVNVGNIKIGGGSSSQVLSTDGLGNLSWATFAATSISNGTSNVNIATSNGNVTVGVAGTANIATFTANGVTFTGTTTIQQAKEKFVPVGTGLTGTYNFDVLSGAIVLETANATANFTINFRGNSTVTFNDVAANNESTSLTVINKNGSTGYYANVIQIDGTTVTPVWPGGSSPTTGTVNGYDMYNFNILKTNANTYVVFASIGGYA